MAAPMRLAFFFFFVSLVPPRSETITPRRARKKMALCGRLPRVKSHAAGGDGKVSRPRLCPRRLSRTLRYVAGLLHVLLRCVSAARPRPPIGIQREARTAQTMAVAMDRARRARGGGDRLRLPRARAPGGLDRARRAVDRPERRARRARFHGDL